MGNNSLVDMNLVKSLVEYVISEFKVFEKGKYMIRISIDDKGNVELKVCSSMLSEYLDVYSVSKVFTEGDVPSQLKWAVNLIVVSNTWVMDIFMDGMYHCYVKDIIRGPLESDKKNPGIIVGDKKLLSEEIGNPGKNLDNYAGYFLGALSDFFCDEEKDLSFGTYLVRKFFEESLSATFDVKSLLDKGVDKGYLVSTEVGNYSFKFLFDKEMKLISKEGTNVEDSDWERNPEDWGIALVKILDRCDKRPKGLSESIVEINIKKEKGWSLLKGSEMNFLISNIDGGAKYSIILE